MKVNYSIRKASETKFEILRDDITCTDSPVAVVVDMVSVPTLKLNVSCTQCTLSFMHDRRQYALDLVSTGKLVELLKSAGFEFYKVEEVPFILNDVELGTKVHYIEGMELIDYDKLSKAYYRIDRKAASEKTKLANELTEKVKSRKGGVLV